MISLTFPGSALHPVKTIYVVATPYHVLLAHVLAAVDKSSKNSVLMMKEGRADFHVMFNAIKADKNIPFGDVLFLREPVVGKINEKPKWVRQRAQAVEEMIESLQPQNIYIFNDSYLEQRLIHVGKQYGATIFFVEDGGAAYSVKKTPISKWTHLKNRLSYGRDYRQVEVQGTSSKIDYILATYPQHVREELREKIIIELPKGIDSLFAGLLWPSAFLRELHVDLNDLKCEALYVFGKGRSFKRRGIHDYHSIVGGLIRPTLRDNVLAAVKYHPQERQQDPLGLLELGVKLIPQSVPAEMLYYLNKDLLQCVYGDISTSLITARWFLPHARVVSFMDGLGVKDDIFKNVLSQIGVEVL
jgi:hypothetical protein